MEQKFEDFLSHTPDDVERPKPLPVGSYLVVVGAQHRIDRTTSEKQTQFVEYTMQIIQPGQDVDETELESAGGVDGKTIRHTFYLTKAAEHRLLDFLAACGVQTEGRTFGETIPEACNCEVGTYIGMEPDRNDKTRFWPRCQRFFPASAFLERQQAAE